MRLWNLQMSILRNVSEMPLTVSLAKLLAFVWAIIQEFHQKFLYELYYVSRMSARSPVLFFYQHFSYIYDTCINSLMYHLHF